MFLGLTPKTQTEGGSFGRIVGKGHFIGVRKVLARVCRKAGLKGVTPHVLRHTFASVAGDLGYTELTIAGLLGHSGGSVTAGLCSLRRRSGHCD